MVGLGFAGNLRMEADGSGSNVSGAGFSDDGNMFEPEEPVFTPWRNGFVATSRETTGFDATSRESSGRGKIRAAKDAKVAVGASGGTGSHTPAIVHNVKLGSVDSRLEAPA